MKNNLKFLLLAVSASLVLSGCATVKLHPDFADRQKNLKKMASMPPDVSAVELTFNAGSKPLPEVTEVLKTRASSNIVDLLKERGYDVNAVVVDQKALDENAELKEAYFDLQTLSEQALNDILKGKKKEFTYEVGSSVNYFAEKHGVNALILMRQRAEQLSQGMLTAQAVQNTASIATAVLTGVAIGGPTKPAFGLITEIAIIDADSGDILWYNAAMSMQNYNHEKDGEKHVYEHFKALLRDFPNVDGKKHNPKPVKKEEKKDDKSSGSNGTNIAPKAAGTSAGTSEKLLTSPAAGSIV